MDKKYLLVLGAVAAAGYGLGEADLLEAQAKQINHSAKVSVDLQPAAVITWEGFLAAKLCPQVDTDFALTPGTCTVEQLKARSKRGVCVVPKDTTGDGVKDTWEMSTIPNMPGQFVAD